MRGTVIKFDAQRGFGFIQGDDGKSYFAHYSAILTDGYKKLIEGEEVLFDASESPKGLCAINVQLVHERPRSFRNDFIQKGAGHNVK